MRITIVAPLVFAVSACGGELAGVTGDASSTLADGAPGSVGSCNWGGFAPQVTYATPEDPTLLVAADMNNDHHTDLVVANSDGTQSVFALFSNKGSGTFSPAVTSMAQASATSIAVGDSTGDGYEDIYYCPISGGGAYGIAVNKEGVLQWPMGITTGAPGDTTNSLMTGNFDGSGHPNIVTTGSDLEVRTNSHGLAQYPTDPGPDIAAAGDFNGDGKLDIVVGTQSHNTLDVFLNTGTGSFAPFASYAAGSYPSAIAVADFNGDGSMDIAATNFNDNTLGIFLNDGHGVFLAQVTYASGYTPNSIATGDFNGDGHPDLAVPDLLNNVVDVYVNQGDGTFAMTTYATGNAPAAVVAADFNGDGHPDLALTNSSDNTISVLMAQCQ